MTNNKSEKRDARITLYVTPTRKRRLDKEAEESTAPSTSAYVLNRLDELEAREERNEKHQDLDTEARVEALVQEATEEVATATREATRDVREYVRYGQQYAVADFVLSHGDVSDHRRRDALATAQDRLHSNDPLALPDDVDDGDDPGGSTGETTAPDDETDRSAAIRGRLGDDGE